MSMVDPAVVSGLSAVLGALVGGFASIAAAWFSQRAQGRRELVFADIRKRELVYAEFISECSRLWIDSLEHSIKSPDVMIKLLSHFNCIRLAASDEVVVAARRIVDAILGQYYQPNLSMAEIRQLADSRPDDPLATFTTTCRSELELLSRKY
jgi:hypothetical protein